MVTYSDLNSLQRDVLWSVLRIEADGDAPTVKAVQEDVVRERHDSVSRTSVYQALGDLAVENLLQKYDVEQPHEYHLTASGRAMAREQADRRAALVDLAGVSADSGEGSA